MHTNQWAAQGWPDVEEPTVVFNEQRPQEPTAPMSEAGILRAELAMIETMWTPLAWAPREDASSWERQAFLSGVGAAGFVTRYRFDGPRNAWVWEKLPHELDKDRWSALERLRAMEEQRIAEASVVAMGRAMDALLKGAA